jgi:hypothetical protein
VRTNLRAAKIGTLETNSVICGGWLERQRHLATGMKANPGAMNHSTKGALCRHQVTVYRLTA